MSINNGVYFWGHAKTGQDCWRVLERPSFWKIRLCRHPLGARLRSKVRALYSRTSAGELGSIEVVEEAYVESYVALVHFQGNSYLS
jgi:hypothetical protein